MLKANLLGEIADRPGPAGIVQCLRLSQALLKPHPLDPDAPIRQMITPSQSSITVGGHDSGHDHDTSRLMVLAKGPDSIAL